MVFFISNTHDRKLGATGTLHVTATCRMMILENQRLWEATPKEIWDAHALGSVCTPDVIAKEKSPAGK